MPPPNVDEIASGVSIPDSVIFLRETFATENKVAKPLMKTRGSTNK
jgi:hypothetical protein